MTMLIIDPYILARIFRMAREAARVEEAAAAGRDYLGAIR